MFRMISRFLFCVMLLQSSIVFGVRTPARRGTSLPSRSPRTLSRKIDVFLNRIHTQVSSNTYTVKRLKGILNDVQKCKSPRDCIRIVLSARKTYGADAQSNEYKQIWAALLVAVAKHLGNFAQKTLVSVLDELEYRIAFWEEQQARPVHHFLHKNPLRWFMGKRQGSKVKDSIKAVHKIQQQYLDYLGQLSKHMDSFNENANMQQQHAWIMNVLRIVHNVVCPKSKDKNLLQEKALNKNVTKVMMTILSALPKHKQKIEKRIYATQPPNHFARNWMWYTALTAGAVWVYRNRNDKVQEWREKIETGVGNFYNNHLEKPFNNIRSLFSPVDHNRDEEFFRRAERLYREHHGEETNIEELNDFMQRLRNGDMNAIDDIRRLCLNLLPNDLNGNLRAIVNRLNVHIDRFREQLAHNRNASRIPGWLGGNYVTSVNRVRTGIDNFEDLLGGLQGEMRAVNIDRDNPLNRRLRLLVDAYAFVANKVYEGQRLNLFLITAIPTVAVGVGGYYGLRGLYRYFRPKYTFAPMKKALSEISRVLNWYEERPANKMSTIDYGTLLYFVHKLKIDAKHITKESTRHRFLRDVKELALPQFTERQKMHVVTRMYREYDFLGV